MSTMLVATVLAALSAGFGVVGLMRANAVVRVVTHQGGPASRLAMARTTRDTHVLMTLRGFLMILGFGLLAGQEAAFGAWPGIVLSGGMVLRLLTQVLGEINLQRMAEKP